MAFRWKGRNSGPFAHRQVLLSSSTLRALSGQKNQSSYILLTESMLAPWQHSSNGCIDAYKHHSCLQGSIDQSAPARPPSTSYIAAPLHPPTLPLQVSCYNTPDRPLRPDRPLISTSVPPSRRFSLAAFHLQRNQHRRTSSPLNGNLRRRRPAEPHLILTIRLSGAKARLQELELYTHTAILPHRRLNCCLTSW